MSVEENYYHRKIGLKIFRSYVSDFQVESSNACPSLFQGENMFWADYFNQSLFLAKHDIELVEDFVSLISKWSERGEKQLRRLRKYQRHLRERWFFKKFVVQNVDRQVGRQIRFEVVYEKDPNREIPSVEAEKMERTTSLIEDYAENVVILSNLISAISAYIKRREEKMSTTEIFASRLKQARREAGLTQAELALRLGIKRSTYGQYEQNRNEPNISLLPALAQILNRPIEWFLK